LTSEETLRKATGPFGPEAPAPHDLSAYAPAYGDEVRRLLTRIAPFVGPAAAEFAGRFYNELSHGRATAAILARLVPEEYERLRRHQAEHLALILSPELTPEAHFARARHIGWVHERVGLDLPSLLEAYHHYQQQFVALLPGCGLDSRQLEFLRRALIQRLMLDMEAQSVSNYEGGLQIVGLMSDLDRTIVDAGTLADLLQGAVDVLGAFDGILAAILVRPDEANRLQAEAVGGAAGRRYLEAAQSFRFSPSVDEDLPGNEGPLACGWRSGQIQCCESYRQDPTLLPWREAGVALGFRSAAVVPLLDDAGQSFAVLLLYSRWPGFFNTPVRRGLLSHLQQSLSNAVRKREQDAVIPIAARQGYRARLHAGAVEMVYQPIVDLRDGSMRHAEALARLRAADGSLLSPAAFLPAFSNADLLQLFRLGLTQVCRDCRRWDEAGLNLSVSVNLPAEAITQDAYRDTLFDTLAHEQLGAGRIQLEILESSDPVDPEKRDARIAELRSAGLRIVQDDLGSGHSSLLRMDRIAFDAVKLDRGLVRRAVEDPKRALEFIFHLTRLVRGLGLPVTVEGLEDPALIEAVAILGADYGQGYAIARPMPAAQLPQWARDFRYDIDAQQPRTALGALAGYLLWDQQRDMLTQWPDLVEYFSNFPCLVHRYLENQGLQGTALEQLLDENLRLAGFGAGHPEFERTRSELMALLTRQWAQGSHPAA
jgi:EAL domain-containing protein (putative c-di-GMP-specific phosphodiesterase class I)